MLNDRDFLQVVLDARWPNGIRCQKCQGSRGALIPTKRLWACSATGCSGQVSLLTGTIFSDSRKPLNKWIFALQVFLDAKGRLSASEFQIKVGLGSNHTALRWLKAIRELAGKVAIRHGGLPSQWISFLRTNSLLNPSRSRGDAACLRSCIERACNLLKHGSRRGPIAAPAELANEDKDFGRDSLRSRILEIGFWIWMGKPKSPTSLLRLIAAMPHGRSLALKPTQAN
ncbi:MAG: transposase [Holophagaceae bacterium]|nr:transposase [Holophagaceae bacterium]